VNITDQLFGSTGLHAVGVWQMCVRAVIVFAYLLVLLRFGDRRTFGRFATIDIAVAVLLGSTLSRALTGNAPIAATFAASAVLVGLHWTVSHLTYASPRARRALEAQPVVLVRDGQLDHDAMSHVAISEDEIRAMLRSNAGTEDLASVKIAYLERSGKISFVR
jgi:uncharacterized membrane protein YcaP (DUF421 family)